jgi:ABC-type multidrug transport system fused ATPase/permease subunit
MSFFSSLPTLLQCVLFCAFVVIVSVTILVFIRRLYNLTTLRQNHEVAGFTFNIIGTLYAVLLAFLVIVVWNNYTTARQNCDMEANAVSDLYRDANAFPQPIRDEIRGVLMTYAQLVISEEWPIMSKGIGAYGEGTWKAVNRIWQIYHSFRPASKFEEVWYGESVTKLNALMDYRRIRLHTSLYSLHLIMKVFMIVGGIVTISFMYFFGIQNLKSQVIMTAALSLMVALIVFLVFTIENPFHGDLGIKPIALNIFYEHAKLL